jgi:hypothetical protein
MLRVIHFNHSFTSATDVANLELDQIASPQLTVEPAKTIPVLVLAELPAPYPTMELAV